MVLFNLFKNKKQDERKERKGARAVEEVKKGTSAPAKSEKALGWSGGFLIAPHNTEKSSGLAKLHQYVFRVAPRANKHTIASAVEKKYGVTVIRVNTMNVSGKRVRLGKREGRSSGFKKAMVTLKEGQTIEMQ